jgi:homoserine/homoserine lactone efflux protein
VSFDTWVLFAFTETVLCLTPGPAVLFVVSSGLARGDRAALWANAGILSGNAFYFLLSAFGVGAMLVASYQVFTAIQLAGAAYLVYLGAQTWRGAGLALVMPGAGSEPGSNRGRTGPDLTWTGPGQGIDRLPSDGWRMLGRGFLLQTANAKALLFFAALLPQFIDPGAPLGLQISVLAVTSVVIEFIVLACYGYGAGRAAALARQPRFVTVTNRVSGGMLVAAGTAVALSRDT